MDPAHHSSYSSAVRFSLSPAVARAIATHQPIVALESTVIAHGLPSPHNLETALGCEEEVRASGAEPATIGIVAGRPLIGLENEQLDAMGSRRDVVKVNLSNLASTVASQQWGATTVAASLHLAHLAGIRVLATGGIGGVHVGASESFDLSADLAALSRYPLVVVSAGAKAILDLPKTLETLETLGVPVIGYKTDELPAFYSRKSGLGLDLRANKPGDVAVLASTHWQLGCPGAILVAQPVPAELEVPAEEIQLAIECALDAAAASGVAGKEVTPFLLNRVVELTGGRALKANVALLRQNARLAGEIARTLTEMEVGRESEGDSISV